MTLLLRLVALLALPLVQLGSLLGLLFLALASTAQLAVSVGVRVAIGTCTVLAVFTRWILQLCWGTLAFARGVLIVLPLAFLCFLVLAAITNPFLASAIDYAHDRSSAVSILDRDGRWLGVLPPAEFADWSDGRILPPDHTAIVSTAIPPVWHDCAIFLEDREFYGLSGWLGVDPIAVLKSGWQTLTFQRRRGASTLYMQVVRMLHGRSPGQHEAPGQVALRKLGEVFGAHALTGLVDGPDKDAAARFVGMHLPLVIGSAGSGFGEPLHGIELAARILWNRPADQLPAELQAVLAAAIKTPILIAPPGDREGEALARKRWQRVKDRAGYCLRHLPAGAEISAATARLDALDMPAPQIDAALAPLLPADRGEAWRVLVNPVRRALFFARHELANLGPELERVAGPDWRGGIVSAQLTTSAVETRPFVEIVAASLHDLEASLRGVELMLTERGDAGQRAEIVIACADPDGAVRRIYTSGRDVFWRRVAAVGSTAKAVGSIALGRLDYPDTRYLGSTARDAFARSRNEPVRWALNRIPSKQLDGLARAMLLPAFGEIPAATALAFGTYDQTPVDLLQTFRAIGWGVSASPQDVVEIRLLESVVLLDERGVAAKAMGARRIDIPGATLVNLFPRRVKRFVRTVLAATSAEHGTLARLRRTPEARAGRLLAKTGTVSSAGTTHHVHIVGVVVHQQKPWAFLVTVGRTGARALGRKLTAGQFALLAKAAMCAPKEEH